MSGQTQPFEVHLVGSSPLASASEFFTTITCALPKRLQHMPDGETGFRSNYIAWQYPAFPIAIVQPRWGGRPSAEGSAKKYTAEDIKPTGYDDQAIVSYAAFRDLKAAGAIPSGVRFQVSLPTPLSVVRGFVEDDAVCVQVEPLYEERLLQSLRHIQSTIPASELTIQWDLPMEIAVLEYERGRLEGEYWKPYFSPVEAGLIDRLTHLAAAVEPDVEMGYHLCYDDLGHVHFVEPADAGLLVELANRVRQKISPIHRVAYIHMPVPKNVAKEAYFKPLKDLELNDTKLFLGLVHPNDENGTRERLMAAQLVYPNVAGISTECGLGRASVEEFRSILEICALVTM